MNLAWIKNRAHHILHLDETPRQLARAFSIGIFIGFSPFIGFHTLAVILIAWALRLNKFVALTGAFVNNPWTMIVIYAGPTWLMVELMRKVGVEMPPLNYERFKLHLADVMSKYDVWDTMFWRWLYHYFKHYLMAYFIGTTIASIVGAVLAYFMVLYGVRYYRAKKTRVHFTEVDLG